MGRPPGPKTYATYRMCDLEIYVTYHNGDKFFCRMGVYLIYAIYVF